MSNKEKALRFLKEVAEGDIREAFRRFVSPSFIHHNQYFKGDRESLILAMEEAAQNSPNKKLEVKHAVEEGDLVMVHSRVMRANTHDVDVAVVHILRFESGAIVEMWDVGQLMVKDSPNKNGMF